MLLESSAAESSDWKISELIGGCWGVQHAKNRKKYVKHLETTNQLGLSWLKHPEGAAKIDGSRMFSWR